MIRVTSNAVLMATFITGCAGVSRERLEESGIAGKWLSGNSQMIIQCDPARNCESNYGTFIKKLDDEGFVTGPQNARYRISQWPDSEEKVVGMTLNNRRWIRSERYRCI